jgi:ABC-type taurine transport system ATPase subunit
LIFLLLLPALRELTVSVSLCGPTTRTIGVAIYTLNKPLSSRDPNLREKMRIEIKDLQRTFGFSILYVTHDQF